MSRIFVTSDTHFNNEAIIKYCNRPFDSSEEQTEKLIHNWNCVVGPKDTVIHCGDFIMGSAASVSAILPRLNGHIILARGNHDTSAKLAIYAEHPDKITVKDIHYVTHKQLWFSFCHFPILDPAFARMVTQDNSEVCWVHGHVHDKTPFFNKEQHSFNVCVDVTDYAPVPLDHLWRLCRDDFVAKGVWRGPTNPETEAVAPHHVVHTPVATKFRNFINRVKVWMVS